MALTTKQRAFVEAYLSNGFNATQAAITAGYSPKTARAMGSENLAKPDIKAAVEARLSAMAMSADEALYRLSEHARGDMGDFMGLSLDQLKKATKTRLIKKFKRTVTTLAGEGESALVEEKIELELYDAQMALTQILKEQHLRAGEATERTDVTTLSDDDRVARIAALVQKAQQRAASGAPPPSDDEGE